MLLQTQDAGGPRGNFNFIASGTGLPTESATTTGVANSFASFLLDWPNGVHARPEGHRRAGHPALGAFPSSPRTSGRRARTSQSTSACGGSTTRPLIGLEGPGSLSNYDPSTNTLRASGFGTTSDAVNVKNTFSNFNARTGVSWRLNDETVLRAGYGGSTIPFPDNRYAFNYPVKQNYSGSAANAFQRPARWRRASRRRRW